jgi:hypothetical protein
MACSPSSSMWPPRPAPGRSRFSTPRTSWEPRPSRPGGGLQISLIIFLISRFVMTWLLTIFRPTLLLLLMAGFGVLCCLTSMFVLNIVGLIAVVSISAALSLMFPTIYGVALRGLGDDAKFGAAGLVMAILGGAIMPMVHAAVMDASSPRDGFRRAGHLPGTRRALCPLRLAEPQTRGSLRRSRRWSHHEPATHGSGDRIGHGDAHDAGGLRR